MNDSLLLFVGMMLGQGITFIILDPKYREFGIIELFLSFILYMSTRLTK